jgi:hypothetical protein
MKALMKGCDFTIGIALVLLLAGASNADDSKTKHLSCTFAATFVSGVENHLDTNGDGRSASVHQGLVNCNIGRFLLHEEFEFLAPLTAPVSCPAGTTEFDLLQAHVVLTSEKTADQLFFERWERRGNVPSEPGPHVQLYGAWDLCWWHRAVHRGERVYRRPRHRQIPNQWV